MKKVFLNHNSGFSWFSDGDCHIKGYLFDKSGNYFSEDKLALYFRDINSFSDFEERIRYANGSFAVIIEREEELYLATDKIRSIPLFYSRNGGKWIVSDDAMSIAVSGNLTDINNLAVTEFLAAGYVTGNETLVEGIRQVQAGEIIHFKPDDLFAKFYYSYRISDTLDAGYKEMKLAGIKIFEEAFKRLFRSLEGKTAVIPLSGGYDSRLIAAMAKSLDFRNVICFTYGRAGNPEIEISRQVAEKLGFRWHYVEYDEKLIDNFIESPVFRSYFPFASGLSSMFFMQEYFAVYYLKEHKLIPENSVFIPGHSGDFLGGSQLNKHGNLNLEEDEQTIVQRIYDVKYNLKRPERQDEEKIIERIHKSLHEKYNGKNALAYSVHEDWDFKEKLAKFNFNSVSTYCYFGYEFRLPFWDAELLDFFRYLPLQAKINKYLYDDILANHVFEPPGLNFARELQPTEAELRRLKIKTEIKKYLPEEIKRVFKKDNDNLFYHEITEYFRQDIASSGDSIKLYGNSYNSLITQWYIFKVKEFLAELKHKKTAKL